jgi:hypothetical protein
VVRAGLRERKRALGDPVLRRVDSKVAANRQPDDDIHRSLDRRPADLAVALGGVRVAEREESALDADR